MFGLVGCVFDRNKIGRYIACGYDFDYIIKNDGSVWSCGNNKYGQLGLNDINNRSTFTQVTANINNDVKQVACGYYHTFILKNDGSVWSCGDNSSGQLGLGDKTNRSTFTQVTTNINNDVKQVVCGGYHTYILKNDGSVWVCGRNTYGQLGLGDNTNRTTFTQVTTNVKQIACDANHTFILKYDGSVWGCGYNEYGQLGLNDTTNRSTFTQVTTNINNDVKEISCGANHTFILKYDGSVWSCGLNSSGQLGLGDSTNKYEFTQIITDVKHITCGDYYTFILKYDGSLWACGNNGSGQLGLGDTSNRYSFTQVTTNINNDVKQIICGINKTIMLKNDGSILCTGYNYGGYPQLGSSTYSYTFSYIMSL